MVPIRNASLVSLEACSRHEITAVVIPSRPETPQPNHEDGFQSAFFQIDRSVKRGLTHFQPISDLTGVSSVVFIGILCTPPSATCISHRG